MPLFPILAIFRRVSDDEPFWPTAQTALIELRDREFQARCKAHYKYNDGAVDAIERRLKAKQTVAEQDAWRTWHRR